MAQWWSGSDFDLFMTDEDIVHFGKENAISVCNHRYDIDWLYALMLCQRVGLLGVIKFKIVKLVIQL
jgi:1-acyl-sn-glycerol-3-phosphate acyltransferase